MDAASPEVQEPALGVETGVPPAPAPEPPRPDSAPEPTIARQEQLLSDGIERILCALEQKQASDRFRELQVDRLHAELQQYKSDLVAGAVRPVLVSLIRLHDDMSKLLEALASGDQTNVTPERVLKFLESFREDVETALDRNGVAAFHTETQKFDAKRQRMTRSVETSVPGEVGQVAARLRPGFEQADQLLEKERVAVYVLTRATPA